MLLPILAYTLSVYCASQGMCNYFVTIIFVVTKNTLSFHSNVERYTLKHDERDRLTMLMQSHARDSKYNNTRPI